MFTRDDYSMEELTSDAIHSLIEILVASYDITVITVDGVYSRPGRQVIISDRKLLKNWLEDEDVNWIKEGF